MTKRGIYITKTGRGMIVKYPKEQQDCFIERIKEQCTMVDGCWEWTRRFNYGKPYTSLYWEGKRFNITIRRFLLSINNPDLKLSSSTPIYSTCGNPHCVNPEHLAVGYGAGTLKGHRIASVLRTYKQKIERGEKVNIVKASKELNVSYVTLRGYLAMYEQDPERWERLWNYI